MLLGVIFIASMMTIAGRSNREMELADNLSSCVEETINTLLLEKQYQITDQEEFIADFREGLAETIDNNCNLTVDVAEIDMEKGILSVLVTAGYVHPNGNPGSVSCGRTVVFERMQEEAPQFSTIEYTDENGFCYKQVKYLM